MKTLLIATKNKGKIKDFENFLGGSFEILSLYDVNEKYNIDLDTEETSDTFEGNARLKAYDLHDSLKAIGITDYIILADDSGICVDYLEGYPGVYSARYAGDHDDVANNKKLLKELKGVTKEERKAKYVTCLIAVGSNFEKVVYGELEGYILEEERGSNGFAYDTLFECLNGKCYAEMNDSERSLFSHRNKALEKIKEILIK